MHSKEKLPEQQRGWILAKRLIHGIDESSGKGFFRDIKTKARYRRIFGGLGWPSVSAPGCAVILAEDLFADHESGKRKLHIIETAYDKDHNVLLDKMSAIQESLCRVDWYGNPESSWVRLLPFLNKRLFGERRASVKLFKPPAFSEADRMSVYFQLFRLRTGGLKTLYLDGSPTANEFAQILTDIKEEEFPGVAAVLYALAAMDFRRVDD